MSNTGENRKANAATDGPCKKANAEVDMQDVNFIGLTTAEKLDAVEKTGGAVLLSDCVDGEAGQTGIVGEK